MTYLELLFYPMTTAAIEHYLPLIVATVLGLAIGFERERKGHFAGLRTHGLVCLGSAAFIWLSIAMDDTSSTRVLSQVASGLGFLGAGVILKDGAKVHGLTTAATVWVSGAVGSLCGAGHFMDAAVVAGLVITVNTLKRHND